MLAAKKLLMPLNNPPKIVGTPVTTSSSSATSTLSPPVTVNNPTYLLALGYCYSVSATSPSMLWNGVTMTALSSALEGSYIRLVLFGLQVPNANIGQTSDFSMSTPSGYTGIIGFGLPGVFKATGTGGNNGSSTGPNIAVNSGPGQLVVGGVGCWNTPTATSGTQVGTTVTGTDTQLMALQKPGATGTVALSASQTSTYWTMVGASLKRVSA